jgi:exodeoxyribonuclease VII large subunit
MENCNKSFYKLKNNYLQIIQKNENRLDNDLENLKLFTNRQFHIANNHLESSLENLKKNTKLLVSKNELKFQSLETNIRLANPENVLKRGFSITKINGKIITENTTIKLNDELETITYSNKITSNVTKNEVKNK